MRRRVVPAAAAALLLAIGAADACTPDAFAGAARATGVPPPLLRAIAHVESGGHPYALNVAGRAIYPATLADARRELADAISAGHRPDVGCLQINIRWHPVPDPGVYFGADRAALTAARILRDAWQRHRSWFAAVAEYHAGTRGPHTARGRRYVARVAAALDTVAVSIPPPGRAVRRTRRNVSD